MEKLVQGVHQFQKDVFATHEALFSRLGDGQAPEVLFITCSDSRINPAMLTQSVPGELFVLRNAGNLVPPYGAGEQGVEATVEYAVSALKIKDVVVCGHSHCGAMTALLQPEKAKDLPAVSRWLERAETTRRVVQENYGHVTDPEKRLEATVEENVLVQLENLRTHPSVAAALGRGELHLHAWVYHFEKGKVFRYEPDENQFKALG